MAKRQPLSFNTAELEKNLQQSTGEGVDAFFSKASALQPTPPPKTKQVPTERKREAPAKTSKPKTPAKTIRHRDTTVPRHHDTEPPSIVEAVRKAVKFLGKEAATHRFTKEEKDAIADIIYTYRRQGYDTSENEIARIGINWLVLDYQENGQESVLDQVIKALKD